MVFFLVESILGSNFVTTPYSSSRLLLAAARKVVMALLHFFSLLRLINSYEVGRNGITIFVLLLVQLIYRVDGWVEL